MRMLFAILMAMVLVFPATAAKRTKVTVQKPYAPVRPAQPIVYPMMSIIPFAIAFDLVRRTSCDPNVAVSTGKGDPGFDPAGPQTGNFLIPAIWQRCANRPALPQPTK